MMSGIPRTPEEISEIKQKIVDYLANRMNSTFMGACQSVGWKSTSEGYEWRNEDPAFDKAVIAARQSSHENMLDIAENNTVDLLTRKDPKTTRWFLDRKGKTRGYIPKIESTIDDKRPKIADDATPEQLQEAMATLRSQS